MGCLEDLNGIESGTQSLYNLYRTCMAFDCMSQYDPFRRHSAARRVSSRNRTVLHLKYAT